jgi:16S rRNA (cytosine967-C5)-methyltransferase
VAWDILCAYLDGACARVVPAVARRAREVGLSAGDTALARELVLGALRYDRLYDHLASRFLRPGRQPVALVAILRIAAHQLYALDRIPPHAVGATCTGVLAATGERRLVGVANAVIRRLAEGRAEMVAADADQQGPLAHVPLAWRPPSVAEQVSLPDLLLEHLPDVSPTALAALLEVPALCTRLSPAAAAGEPIEHPAIIRREGPWLWWSDPAAAIATVVGPGLARVQDRNQARLRDLLPADIDGWRVLDLCAAPGGKSALLAEAGARVVAADSAPRKVAHLHQQVPAVAALVQDGCRPALAAGVWDVVVVDAPCSNSGVLARRPEAKARYDAVHLADLADVQQGLLHAAGRLAGPGGLVLYATCSVAAVENQERIAPWVAAGWQVLGEHEQWPDAWGAGAYAALLRLPGGGPG